MNTKNYIALVLFLVFSCYCFAQNPIIKNRGVSDPHIRVFNDTIFLYSGHDSHPTDKIWKMKDWRIFSSTDLLNWTIKDTISPKENYMDDASEDCWASDAISRNGKYYFYFSDRKRGIGVMTSDNPSGPFIDPLNKPLVSPMHDPTILIDDDEHQTPYLVYGDKENKNGFHIAQLNDDMISLAELPKVIKISGKEWENAPRWMDKNYIFKYNKTYYLSWGRDYAVSDNIYGPYTSVGSVGVGHNLNELAHGSFFKWKGQFYHIWCYYIKNGFKYRTSIITYCHIDDKGKIVTDTNFLDNHFANGVGQYNASWNKIEAEWFYEIFGNIKKKGNKKKGFILSNIKNGDWIKFANLTFDKIYKKIKFKIKSNSNKGLLEIRLGSVHGKVLGQLNVKESKILQELSTKLNIVKGKHDIFIVFKGLKDSRLDLDWLKFE